jgi:hypothetical protein
MESQDATPRSSTKAPHAGIWTSSMSSGHLIYNRRCLLRSRSLYKAAYPHHQACLGYSHCLCHIEVYGGYSHCLCHIEDVWPQGRDHYQVRLAWHLSMWEHHIDAGRVIRWKSCSGSGGQDSEDTWQQHIIQVPDAQAIDDRLPSTSVSQDGRIWRLNIQPAAHRSAGRREEGGWW